MPPHIQRRTEKGSYYLIDGRTRKSLHTTVKGQALELLEKYVKGKLKLTQGITIGEFYEGWIKEKQKDRTIRKSLLTSYRQHFSAYVLDRFRFLPLNGLGILQLSDFRNILIHSGLSLKTIRNVIDGSLRGMWKDARRAGLVESNPFELLDWPAYHRPPPDPYTVEERDRILAWVAEHESFYYPWVYFHFATGCRPSEASALRWGDLDEKNLTISISKSRNMGVEHSPKTKMSYRRIKVDEQVFEVVSGGLRVPGNRWTDDSYVFSNKVSHGPLNAHDWTRIYWKRICDGANVRHRKFYSTRHTSITEAIRRGENPLAVAQYHGTSLEMIQRNYCGVLEIGTPNLPQNVLSSVVVPAGIEPARVSKRTA